MSNSEIQLRDEPCDSVGGSNVRNDELEEESVMDEEKKEFLLVFGPAYASNAQFWKGVIFSCAPQGALMACIALAFFNFYTAMANATWLTEEYHHALSATLDDGESHGNEEDPIHMFRLGNGEWWYVGLLAGAGFAVGLVKTIWTLLMPERHAFPRKVPGFLTDIRGLHAHDIFLPLPVLICSAISIGLGASVGPEAALGATGTALGTFLSKRWRFGKHQAVAVNTNHGDSEHDEPEEKPSWLSKILPDFSQDEKHVVMDGIAGAFGALFPAQYLSPMLIFELGHHWDEGSALSATETLARTGFSATIGYIVFTSVQDFTLLKQASLPGAAYDLLPEINVVNMFEGGALGIVCGFIGAVGLLILGLGQMLGNLTHNAFDRVGEKVGLANRRISLGMLLTPVVGGTLVGLLCVLSPLCISDGADQLGSVVTLGQSLGAGVIAVVAVVKFMCLAFSIGFGFVGGPIFPFLFVGTCVGTIAPLIIDGLPVVVAVPACMVAVPCAFIPAIFTFTTLASMVLVLGGAATSPVFFACICSYTTVCGFGELHEMFERSRASRKEDANKPGASNEHADVMAVEEEGAITPNDAAA